MFIPDESLRPPPSWLDPEILGQEVEMTISVGRLLVLQGCLALAVRHPNIGQVTKQAALEQLDIIEDTLEQAGLERPVYGWRAAVVIEPPPPLFGANGR